jgi:hypothetical protein
MPIFSYGCMGIIHLLRKIMDHAKDSKEKEEEAENTFAPSAIRTHC